MHHRHNRAAAAVLAACLTSATQAAPTADFDSPAKSPGTLAEQVKAGAETGWVPEVPEARAIAPRETFAQGDWTYWIQVRALAHQVEEKARHVHREAESRAHHGDYRERRALADLHALEQKAAHFHRQVESYRRDPGHTRHDLQSLIRAFNAADNSLRWAHFNQHVRHDFETVRGSLQQLEWYYRRGGYQPPHRDPHRPWPPRHPHHGRPHH